MCPRMGGKSPQTPLLALGANCALEWGEIPPKPPLSTGGLHDKPDVQHGEYCLNIENVNFYSIVQKGASNKSFLSLNISRSYLNYALPHMTPTYPENIRLLGPRSWEEIESQQTTDRLPTRIHHPSHSPPHNTCNSFLSIFYTKPSAFGLGLDKIECNSYNSYFLNKTPLPPGKLDGQNMNSFPKVT